MLSILSKLFRKGGGNATAQKPSVTIADEEIPRYPPFARGIPAASVDRIVSDQRELIDDLRHAAGLSNAQYTQIIEPVIRRYAEFVHLLPASQQHHHRAAGGLFRHGLEVALLATRATEDYLFSPHETPQRRRDLEPRWRVAALFAGLLHDCGKPLSDLTVTNRDGTSRWRPLRHTLLEWAEENKIDRYFLNWQPNRHRRHEQFSATAVSKILTVDAIDWLDEYGAEIYGALLAAIAAPEKDTTKLNAIVRDSDNASVEKDLKRTGSFADDSLGVPVERHIMDAARRLLNAGVWKVNQPGARVWVLKDGVYIVWKPAAEEIFDLLKQDNVPGIPRDADTIAEILLDRALAKRREHKGVQHRYWPIRPDILEGKKLMMLRLSHPEMLFNEPPAPTNATVDGDENSPEHKPTAPPQLELTPPPVTAQTSKKGKASGPASSPASVPEPAKEEIEPENLSVPEVPQKREPAPEAGQPVESSRKRESEPAPANQKAEEAPVVVEFPGPQTDIPEADILRKMVTADAWDKHLHWRPPYVVVSYPDGMLPAGNEAEVLQRLKAAGYIVMDPLAPMRLVRTHEGVSGVVLSEKASNFLRKISAPKAEPAAPAQSKPNAAAATKPQPAPAPSKPSDEQLIAQIIEEMHRIAKTDARVSIEDGWITTAQVAISRLASTLGVPAGDIRRVCANHNDIKLVGTSRLMIRKREE